MEMMRLCDVPRNSKISIKHLGLIAEGEKEPIDILYFHGLDGSVGVCYYKDKLLYLYPIVEVYLINDES